MKLHQILAASTLGILGLSMPQAAVAAIGLDFGLGQISVGSAELSTPSDGMIILARRGSDDRGDRNDDRGRGRGGDDDSRDHDRGRSNDDDDSNGSGRSRPRVPGGSGCDDAGDIAEHAECS